MKKPTLFSEAAYLIGLPLLALGTACMELGGLGISMVAAPSYVIYLKVSQIFPAFSFGTCSFILEGLVLLVMALILRRFRLTYVLPFVTAVLYGLLLDGAMLLLQLLPPLTLIPQIAIYCGGFLLCTSAIALILYAYFPPAAHEMFVKEISAHKKCSFAFLKTIYDCTFLAIALVLSLLFFGNIQGVGIGTVVCAFINGTVIRMFTNIFNKLFIIRDAFPVRNRFEESEEVL